MASWLDVRFEGWAAGFAVGRDRITGAPVHLKTAQAPEAERALEREVRAHHLVSHPSLRPLLGQGRIAGARAAAFAWVDASAVAAGDDLQVIAIGVLRGLLALHASGLVHGDLKPEHVLVARGRAWLIDLGLAVRIGEPPAGGTAAYLAPEYRAGAVASVAGDLFAFGQTFRTFDPRGPLASLVARACDADPTARPVSCEAALAVLGARPSARDRIGHVEAVGRAALLETVVRGARAGIRVRALPGSGATSFTEDVARHLRGAVAVVDAAHAPLAAALVASAEEPVFLVVDGATDVAASVVVGDVESPHVLGPLDAARIALLAEQHRVSLSAAETERLAFACEGRAGRIARVMMRLAADDTLGLEDALVIGDVEGSPSVDALAHAASALAAGRSRVAVLTLRARWPDLAVDGPREARTLLGRALAEAGELAPAAAVLAALDAESPLAATDLLALARALERLGRTDALLALRRDLAGPDRAELAAMVAAASFTRGRLADARALAEETLAGDEVAPPVEVRLLCIASDCALRTGDAPGALTLAERALARARVVNEPRPIAQSHARVAGVHAMAGRWSEARTHYVDALGAAERAADRTALSPYLMNLAAAEHALFEVDAAIGHYERAVALARELGRAPSEAAALTNLATLLELVGAAAEAGPLLDRAEMLAREAGVAVAVAQARMFHAEVHRALGARDRAVALSREAHDAFAALGVERQALECALLCAELAADAGESVHAFLESRTVAAREAGLGARVSLLAARSAEARGDVAAAARILELALAEAERSGEREPALRIAITLADAHRRLGTGAASSFEARARELRGSLALHVPPGLRERFLERHPLPEIATSRGSRFDPAARAIASLLRRTLRATDESLVLEAAVDEAIALTHAERAFLLARRPGRPVVSVARNLDKETIKNSRFRFSRSVAERVLSTGEPLVTASASDDPELASARSILDLGVRSILCVPIRGRGNEVLHALYLDHRFERARFSDADLEVVEALADVIGLCLENARLHGAAQERERELVLAQESLRADAEARAIEMERLSRSLEAQTPASSTDGIVGRSRSLRAAVDLARRVAPSVLPVLIEGESGTGKELFAKLVHRESPRRAGPMLSLNCGALPESLLESELFGHVRGAFTGALRDQPGLFRAADGGTLFLDEIGEMPIAMQARLLRVLADGEVRPVGATRGVKVDVRIVAATNRDLPAEVKRGGFREDLFFRIAGVRIVLPPLRERREDLALLCASILAALGEKRPLAPDALRALALYALPGNVRELEGALRRASIVADGDALHAVDLGLSGAVRAPRARIPTRAELEAALAEHRGNRSHAAGALGVHRTTIHRLLDKHGITSDARRGRPRTTR